MDNRATTAMDVTYHKDCWTNNVFHILRKKETLNLKRSEKVAKISAKIEFCNHFLSQGQVFHVKKIHELYIKIRSRCNVKIPEVSWKTQLEFPNKIEFHKRKRSMSLRVLLLKLQRYCD